MRSPTESTAHMSDSAIHIKWYTMIIRHLLFLVGELQGPLHHFSTVYLRTAPSRKRHCTESVWPITERVTFVEMNKAFNMAHLLAPPTPRRGSAIIAIISVLVRPSHCQTTVCFRKDLLA